MTGEVQLALQPLMLANFQEHILGVLNGRKIKVTPPDEGLEALKEARARRQIAPHGSGLDHRRPLPCAPKAFIVVFRRNHGDAHGRNGRIRAQAQIGAEHIAIRRVFRQKLEQPLGDPHKNLAHLGVVIGIKPRLVKEHNQVDVRGVIQLPRAQFPHAQHRHAAIGLKVGFGAHGQLTALEFIGQKLA